MANVSNLNSYQTPADTFYNPPPGSFHPPPPPLQQQPMQQYQSQQQPQYSPQMSQQSVIQNSTEKFQQAHRLSPKYNKDKTRPVVVMFNHYPDKLLVKQRSQELWKAYHEAAKSSSGAPLTSGASSAPPSSRTDVTTGATSTVSGDEPPAKPTKPKISVSDQFTKSVQDRRKLLLPAMIKAKKAGKSAYLAHDKLYIENKMYTVETVSSSGFSEI
ncbi:cAMP-dependent protein kinase catalytic subunit-like [Mercenaria mercenaria]|uniref:cAMP-dependent protein kinase catalytic subunit-like n=1 Tax=Mercenaria mercenaria TaxID=6596 RepID=UPI00234F2F5B|nr:cAMP-dependent protein kinase catalytic subunit-like [Mercenaria mercenaria]